MTFDEAVEKLKSEDYAEAYAFFVDQYNSTGDLKCKYYIAMVDFHNAKESDLEKLYHDFRQLLALPKVYHTSIYLPLISICIDLEKNRQTLEFGNRALAIGLEDPFVYIAMARAMFNLKLNLLKASDYCDKALNGDLSLELYPCLLETKINICVSLEDFDSGIQFINQCYLRCNHRDFIVFEHMRLLYCFDRECELLEGLFESIMNNEDRYRAIQILFDFNYNHRNMTNTIKYADLLLEQEMCPDDVFTTKIRKALAYQELNQTDLAIAVFNDLLASKYREAEVYYHMGAFYYYQGFKKGILEAIDCFKKGLEIGKSVEFVNFLADCYYELGDIKEMYSYTVEAQKRYKKEKNSYFLYLNYLYYLHKGMFDKAHKYLDQAFAKGIIPKNRYYQMAYMVAKNPLKYVKGVQMSFADGDNSFFCRQKAKMYLYGDYEENINPSKALENAQNAFQQEKCNCNYSIVGSCLPLEEGLEYWKEGARRYQAGEDPCPCSLAFVAKSNCDNNQLMEAYLLLKKAVIDNGIKVTEGIANLYGYLSSVLDIDVLEAYKFLNNYFERRYQVGTLYSLMKLEEKQGIDIKETQSKFQKALKWASKAEKTYYSNCPTYPFLNNL